MQIDLPGMALAPRRPLLCVNTAATLLDLDPIEVAHACESGELEYAFDLATPGAARRELRIWRGSVLDVLKAQRVPRSEAEVLADILPPHDPRTSEVKRRLQISRDLLADLLREAGIEVAQRARAQSGVNAAAKLRRESVVRFLLSRRIGNFHHGATENTELKPRFNLSALRASVVS